MPRETPHTYNIASFKEFSLGGTRLKISTQKSKVQYTPANFSSYWSSKLFFIQHYLWWKKFFTNLRLV